MEWISVKDRLPSKSGVYVVTCSGSTSDRFVKILGYTKNLTKLDKWDFPKGEYDRAGFYGYDSDLGYYEETRVLAWMELPAVYEGE